MAGCNDFLDEVPGCPYLSDSPKAPSIAYAMATLFLFSCGKAPRALIEKAREVGEPQAIDFCQPQYRPYFISYVGAVSAICSSCPQRRWCTWRTVTELSKRKLRKCSERG